MSSEKKETSIDIIAMYSINLYSVQADMNNDFMWKHDF